MTIDVTAYRNDYGKYDTKSSFENTKTNQQNNSKTDIYDIVFECIYQIITAIVLSLIAKYLFDVNRPIWAYTICIALAAIVFGVTLCVHKLINEVALNNKIKPG